jgi:PadR family transcriptional regulator AphA
VGTITISLSDTEYAVLGLLTFGERSGYELDKLAGRSIGYFWRPAKSKIYAILPRLVVRGLAESSTVAQARRPDKQLYRLTPSGLQTFREWLESDNPVRSVSRDGLLLKLFFGASADPEAMRAQLRQRKNAAERQLTELGEIERSIDRDENVFPYLTLLHGIEDARSTITWVERALAELDRRSSASSVRSHA